MKTERRSGWAVLAAGALVASLLAVGASPAAAIDEDSKQDHEATFTACLGPALADHGFTDLGTLEATVADINCLAYYGVTIGTSETTFSPNTNVTRSQMALFLYRAAGLMGVDLMGGDMMADFGDVSELGEDRQAAIAALARNGILEGRGDMAFEPGADITRAEMAKALVSLVDHTPGAPVHKNDDGLFVLGDNAETAEEPDDHFADARASVPRAEDNAISAAYELGITSGVGDGTSFDPHGTVPRRNMATFIARAMAHSNLRPAGLTAQVHENTKVTVSVRGDAPDFAPMVNRTVDVFRAAVADEARAFTAAGACSATRTQPFEGSAQTGKCEIDGADPVTQTNGNVELTLGADVGDGQTVWVWAGDIGDKVTADTNFARVSITKEAETSVEPASAEVSSDLPKVGDDQVDRAHFGTTVTLTIQLKGGGDDADKDAAPDAGSDPPEYEVVIEELVDTPESDGSFDLADATRLSQDTVEVTIGADGSATFTVTAADQDAKNRGNYKVVRYTVTTGDINGDGTDEDDVVGRVVFSDEAPVVTFVSVGSSGSQVAPGASSSAANWALVTVRDQFGDPVSDAGIVLRSSNPIGAGDTDGSDIRSRALNTGRSGTVRIGYSYSGGASQETLVAMWDGGTAGDLPTDVSGTYTCGDGNVCGETMVNWVFPTQLATSPAVGVLSLEAGDDQVIVDLQTNNAVTPTSINYDSNDFFNVISVVDGGDVTTPMSLAGFEEALAKGLKAFADGDGSAPQRPTLQWSSYQYDESSDIASFTLDVTPS